MKKTLLALVCVFGAVVCMADFFSLDSLKKEGESVVDQQKSIAETEKQKVQDEAQKKVDELKSKPEAEKQKLLDAQQKVRKDAEDSVLNQEKKGIDKVNEAEKKLLSF
ncbi:MAG: hypothetical protein MJ016_02100 [Victivallaceae bacterium]|nr:hypothetical protein [Victivallaceae bacterium]